MLNRPSLKGTPKEVLEYIEQLEVMVEGLDGNGAVQFMLALNRQLMDLAKDMADLKIDLTGKDDKTLDRFIKMATVARGWTADFKAFIQEYGPQIKEESTAGQPLIERLINKRGEKGN
jgi:hypothetical protein